MNPRAARWALALLLALAAAPGVRAERLALLVGVSAYPQLAPRHQLQGPAQDVRRMREALLLRGFAARNIRLLADGIDGGELPTRAAILGALAELGGRAGPGDTVVMLFAGHGSQQPADDTEGARDEADGWHETFLPRDVRGWNGQRGVIEGAITDTSLRTAVDRISDRGAFVWAMFDACHSGTLVRAPEDGRPRQSRRLLPAELSPEAPLAPPRRLASRIWKEPAAAVAGRSPAVYFYAAQSDESAFELPLPEGAPGAVTQGLFSYVISRALAAGVPMSYRQLGQHVMAAYAQRLNAPATPLFTGDGLDLPVLNQAAPPVRQWPLLPGDPPRVGAGALDELAVGARFEVLPDPLAPVGPPGGGRPLLRVSAVHPAFAELQAVAGAGPAPPPRAAASGTYLRLVSNPPSYLLRVAVDRRGCDSVCSLGAVLERLRGDGVPGVELRWVDARQGDPDITIEVHADGMRYRLRDEPETGDAPGSRAQGAYGWKRVAGPDAPAPEMLALRVADDLHRLARERNLLQMAARLALSPPTAGATMEARLQRAAGRQESFAIQATQVPVAHDGDQLRIAIHNTGAKALDITLLAIDAGHGIETVFPRRRGESNRLEAGATQRIEDITVNARRSQGTERLLLIWVPVGRLLDRRDFGFLQQPPLSRTRAERAAAEDPDLQALVDACFASHLTRADPQPAVPAAGLGMSLLTLQVQR